VKSLYRNIKIIGIVGVIASLYLWFTDYREGIFLLVTSIPIIIVGYVLEWFETPTTKG